MKLEGLLKQPHTHTIVGFHLYEAHRVASLQRAEGRMGFASGLISSVACQCSKIKSSLKMDGGNSSE